MSGRRICERVGRLDVLVDESTSMESAKCGGQRDRQPQKASDLHRLADEPIEGFASRVRDDEHHPSVLAYEFQWLQRPRRVDVVSQFVFAYEAIGALEVRLLGARKHWDESVPNAFVTVALQPAVPNMLVGKSEGPIGAKARVVFSASVPGHSLTARYVTE